MVARFFNHEVINKLWDRGIFPFLTFDQCFTKRGPISDIIYTFRVITYKMTINFGYEMPKWWIMRFPSIASALEN